MHVSHLCLGMNDLAAGTYVPGKGWVGANDPNDFYGEAQREIKRLYELEKKRIFQFKEERYRVRLKSVTAQKHSSILGIYEEALNNRDIKQCMELCMMYGLDIDTVSADGTNTVLLVACEENTYATNHEYMLNDNGQPVVQVAYLLDRKDYRPNIDLMLPNQENLSPLMKACLLSRYHIVEALLDRGASINICNRYRRTALHYAVMAGSTECCRILIERGADLSIKDCDDCIPSDIADENGFDFIKKLISCYENNYFGYVVKLRGRINKVSYCPNGCGVLLNKEDMKAHVTK